MKVTEIKTSTLAGRTADYNPRQIKGDRLDALRRVIGAHGVVENLVQNKRSPEQGWPPGSSPVLISGHQRVRVAQAEKIPTLPVHEVDVDAVRERQLNLALNGRYGEFTDKLPEVLDGIRREGGDLRFTGFTPQELEGFLRNLGGEPGAGGTDPDQIPEPPTKPITKPGQLVRLGDHALVCGDAGDPATWSRLGTPVHLVYTDPPYNVKVEPRSNNAIAAAGKRRKHHQGLDLARHPEKSKPTGRMRPRDRALENDFVDPSEYDALLLRWFGAIADALEPGRAAYLWGGYHNAANYPPAIKAAGLYFSQAIIWHKHWPVLTRKDFMGDHEWCFYCWKEGAAHYFNPEVRNEPDVWCAPKETPNAELADLMVKLLRDRPTDVWCEDKIPPAVMRHLTEKPVGLATRALIFSSRPGETVADPFAGSGSTLIAAEQMGRRARLIEIDPAYCDVIIERWESFTGRKAEHETDAR